MFFDLVDTQLFFFSAAQHQRRARLKAQQLPDGAAGLGDRHGLQIAPKENQRGQHAVAEEIQLDLLMYREADDRAVEIDDRRRERDQQIHAHGFTPQSTDGVAVEVQAGTELQSRCEHELDKGREIPQQRHGQRR